MQISFNGTFQQQASILHKTNKESSYRPQTVSIVELDPNDKYDKLAVNKVEQFWIKSKGYPAIISDIQLEFQSKKNLEEGLHQHFFALTSQLNNFEKLEPGKILGLTVFSEYEQHFLENEIELIASHPSGLHRKGTEREYTNIGKNILDFLISKYKEKTIYVEATPAAIKFYEKMGFSRIDKEGFALQLLRHK